MIKNIVFDMSDVMLRFDRNAIFESKGISGEDRILLDREVYLSIEWSMVDEGIIDEEEAYRRMCARLPERLHEKVRQLVFEWEKPVYPMPGMAELVKELREKNYNVYLLSNAGRRQPVYWQCVPGHEYFMDTLVSYEVGVVKPQPEIYLMALNRFKIDPRESVFIDDNSLNAAGAMLCGMEGIVFHGDSEELRNKLRVLKVDC